LNQAFKADFKEFKESVKSIKTVIKKADSALRKLEKLINKYSSNKLIKTLKYIKAEFLNISYIT